MLPDTTPQLRGERKVFVSGNILLVKGIFNVAGNVLTPNPRVKGGKTGVFLGSGEKSQSGKGWIFTLNKPLNPPTYAESKHIKINFIR